MKKFALSAFALCLVMLCSCSSDDPAPAKFAHVASTTVEAGSAAIVMAPAGSSLEGAMATLPAGALPAGGELSLSTAPNQSLVDEGFLRVSRTVRFSAKDEAGNEISTFNGGMEATIQIPYDQAAVDADAANEAGSLQLFRANDDDSDPVVLTIDSATNGIVTAKTDHFSMFWLMRRRSAKRALSLSSVSPNKGPVEGGSEITIHGRGFVGTPMVTIGGNAATDIQVWSSRRITCTTAAGSEGVADVVVQTSFGSESLSMGFTYEVTPVMPTISSINPPSQVGLGGGNSFTITGSGFSQGPVSVMFGSMEASNVLVENDTTVIGDIPTGISEGAVDVVVSNAHGSATLTDGFTYAAEPSGTALAPYLMMSDGNSWVSNTLLSVNVEERASFNLGGGTFTTRQTFDGTILTEADVFEMTAAGWVYRATEDYDTDDIANSDQVVLNSPPVWYPNEVNDNDEVNHTLTWNQFRGGTFGIADGTGGVSITLRYQFLTTHTSAFGTYNDIFCFSRITSAETINEYYARGIGLIETRIDDGQNPVEMEPYMAAGVNSGASSSGTPADYLMFDAGNFWNIEEGSKSEVSTGTSPNTTGTGHTRVEYFNDGLVTEVEVLEEVNGVGYELVAFEDPSTSGGTNTQKAVRSDTIWYPASVTNGEQLVQTLESDGYEGPNYETQVSTSDMDMTRRRFTFMDSLTTSQGTYNDVMAVQVWFDNDDALHYINFYAHGQGLIREIALGAQWSVYDVTGGVVGGTPFGDEIPSAEVTWHDNSASTRPAERSGHGMVNSSGLVYMFGGAAGPNFNNDLWTFDSSSNTWTDVADTGDVPSQRSEHAMVSFFDSTGKIFVWGGTSSSGGTTDGAVYDTSTMSWTSVSTTNAPSERRKMAAFATSTGNIVIWGGDGISGAPMNDGAIYNPTLNGWTTMSSSGAPTARRSAQFAFDSVHDVLYVFGGQEVGSNSFVNDLYAYDVAGDSWTQISGGNPPVGRTNGTMIFRSGKLFIWGGSGQGFVDLNDGAIYDIGLNTWTATSMSGAPSGRNRFVSVNSGNGIVIWAGNSEEGIREDGFVFDIDANTWSPLTTDSNTPAGVSEAEGVYVGRVVIFGGRTTPWTNAYGHFSFD